MVSTRAGLVPKIRSLTQSEGSWVNAACRALPADRIDSVFFPETGGNVYGEAKKLCNSCPVLQRCRVEAINDETLTHGMFGGFTPTERDRIRRARRYVA